MGRRTVALGLAALPALVSVTACFPYDRSGDYYAGPVDPAGFQAAYKGAGYATSVSNGTIEPVAAFAGGKEIAYYSFPIPTGVDPLVMKDGAKNRPLAYIFDPKDSDPFPDPATCTAPKDYVYDIRRDFVYYNEQGNIVTALPAAATYTPVYSEVKINVHGMPCQAPKAAEDVVLRKDITFPDPLIPAPPGAAPPARATGTPDGKYVAWAVIDPAASVLFPDGTVDFKGDGPQKWGWFAHYLMAYIDGGYIPTKDGMRTNPDMMTTRMITEAVPQNLYVPKPSKLGTGADILEHVRGEVGYSPICHVRTFTPTDPKKPPTNAAEVEMASLDPETKPVFVYCLQVN
jgi:hypothetical protein